MLDIKSKNKRRLTIFILLCTILVPGFYTASMCRSYYRNVEVTKEDVEDDIMVSENFLGRFIEAGFILYNTERNRDEMSIEESEAAINDYFNYIYTGYEEIYPYLEYRAEDEEGNVVDASTANTGRTLTEDTIDDYGFGIIVSYDESGSLDIEGIYGEYNKEQSVVLRRILGGTDQEWQRLAYDGEEFGLERPSSRTYYFALTEENLKEYVENQFYEEYQVTHVPEDIGNIILVLILLAAALAWIYPMFPFMETGNEQIFKVKFEVAAAAVIAVAIILEANDSWFVFEGGGYEYWGDTVYWSVVFAVSYWASSCMRQIYVLKPKQYITERTFLYPAWKYVRRTWRQSGNKVKDWFSKVYHSLDNIDLAEDGNKAILKIVICNFVILAAVCSLWFFGIMALIIYSVILFFILRKYYNDLKEKYGVLLEATNQIAEGNLEVEIKEDLGLFSPFRTEIEKIQTGFKKAVDEEVKSQRMKTELITNVSHDLKTPLTAIITYVDLLKGEEDEEKRKAYVDVLESKSLRLKVLIEDLFEISKASSKNVTLHIVEVDIVNLFKQVKLELEDKFTAAEVDFRCSYPEQKLLVPLDSQKTYRIFENLLVNVSKYAMPHTRAYVEIIREGGEAVVRIKNISSSELTFNPEEITDRFVRGDVSRNTEGSGLGLAIAKSFTELQKGIFKIETEADLFKAEIRFVC